MWRLVDQGFRMANSSSGLSRYICNTHCDVILYRMTGSLTWSLLGSSHGWIPCVPCMSHIMTTSPCGCVVLELCGSIYNIIFDKIVGKVCGLFLHNNCDLCLQWGWGTKFVRFWHSSWALKTLIYYKINIDWKNGSKLIWIWRVMED